MLAATHLVSTEERPRLAKANLTHGVFQVGVDLNLKGRRKESAGVIISQSFKNSTLAVFKSRSASKAKFCFSVQSN